MLRKMFFAHLLIFVVLIIVLFPLSGRSFSLIDIAAITIFILTLGVVFYRLSLPFFNEKEVLEESLKASQYKVIEMGKDFVANASHELRTPITIIKGFAETLQDLPKISPTMLAEITEKIVRNCHRMEVLVKNLLTLSDIENMIDSKFQSCDIVALADNCKYLILTLAPTAQVDIEKSRNQILVDADPDLLELCLMNLLENGIKYSKPPAHLTIHLEEGEGEVIIGVQDRGIGIAPDAIPHIFERFYTVNKARSRQLGGAGLGLSIVHTIIDKHKGTILVASTVGQGTTFTIRLKSVLDVESALQN